MDHTVLLVLLLAFCTTAIALDSEGTNFVWAFVRNANAANISNQVLTATVISQNALNCKFTLTYRPDYHKSTPPENITQTILPMTAIEVEIPNWYGWNYAGANVQDDVYLTLMGYSTCPVTVLANNIDSLTGQGDTFMVLPTNWGSKSFTFSLPPAVISTDQQYEQIFVLPTTEGVTRVNVVEIGNAQSIYSFNVTYGNAPAVYIGARTPDKRPRTYHVTSDKDVLIVAGVTCAGADVNSCDHVAYMPHPPPASDCYPYDYYDDDHMAYLPTTSQFFADIPGTCLVGQNITSTLNDGVSKTITIKPQMESPLWTITTTNAAQLGVSFHNGGSNIHIARYYDGTKFNTRGAFVATSPSVTQYHNAKTTFYTRNANDTLELYCNVLACASITIDGTKIQIADTKVVQKVDGISYYMFSITIANPGFHMIDLNEKGEYSFFIYGKNKQYSYGYEGGCNKPTFVLAPPTTTIPWPTTTPGPSTASVSTQSPPTTQPPQTTATPPATQPSTASPQTPVTSKQTSTIASQTTSTGPVVTITQPQLTTASKPPVTNTPSQTSASTITTAQTQPSQTSASTIATVPTKPPQTSASTVTTAPTQSLPTSSSTSAPTVTTAQTPPPQTSASTNTPTSIPITSSSSMQSTATTATKPVVTTNSVTPAPSSAPTTAPTTVPIVTTQTVPVTTSTVAPVQTTVTTPVVVTSTQTIVTVPTTVTTVPTTVTTAVPVVTTATTAVPVVTTATTQIPVVTTQTTQTTPNPSPQTSSPIAPTTSTASPSPVGSTVTTPTVAPVTTTVTVPQPPVTTTTVAPPPVTTTTAKPPQTTVTTKPTQPVTTPTNPPVTTPKNAPVTTPSTAPVTTPTVQTTQTVPVTTPPVTVPVTTVAPSTTTQSSSMVSIALPVVLTFLFALF
ncbi:hypothetical protein CAEBREN_15151 [Caenorhabditis brenneri]|uniref:Uncharacterized protein n=1 Tax=Caenorhabditis brenneri TaxID=135651 RepID=G0M7N7_CAEBE|nr:hypothetical protein CAEBREN_15151 [Caenorhabditis brenneri]